MPSVADIMGDRSSLSVGLCVCCGVTLLLGFVILLPISISYLDFYDYGFLRGHMTGQVQLDPVYEGGRHFVGPHKQ